MKAPARLRLDYGIELETALREAEAHLKASGSLRNESSARWLALKALEQGDLWRNPSSTDGSASSVREAADLQLSSTIRPEIAIPERRYSFIAEIIDDVISWDQRGGSTLSERLDALTTHPWLGLPLFLILMYLVFSLVMNVSAPYVDWVDSVIHGPLASWTAQAIDWAGLPDWVSSLASEGILAGVGGVLVFLPGLASLYFFIGLLEDSGYMARAAFVMDRLMQVLGLQGKSFIPMILGFGCAVPAVYATRMLESRRDRLITGLLIPYMSCSARLPVYVVFGMAFFGARADKLIWGLYALGIVVAVLVGVSLSATILKPDREAKFLLEMPPFRRVSARSLWMHVALRTRHFLQRAGTVILTGSLVIWGLLNLPGGGSDLSDSFFGRISRAAAPVFAPAGFGTWQATGSLVTGLAAKEVVVSTLSQVYVGSQPGEEVSPLSLVQGARQIAVGFGNATIEAGEAAVGAFSFGLITPTGTGSQVPAAETALSRALASAYSPAAGAGFMVFVLLYVPCIATLAAMQSEYGRCWAVTSGVLQLTIAWLFSVGTFQFLSWAGLG